MTLNFIVDFLFITIYNIEQIDRGYENIDGRLKALGANIVRVN